MEDIRLRPAATTEASSIAALHARSWRDAYASILDHAFLAGPVEADRHALWNERLRNPSTDQIIDVAESGDEGIVGFGCAYGDRDPRWGSLIDNLHVTPSLRGRGLGERLLRSLVSQLARTAPGSGVHLWVFEANASGLRFYERLSGTVVEEARSGIASARGQTVLRIYWPCPGDVVRTAR